MRRLMAIFASLFASIGFSEAQVLAPENELATKKGAEAQQQLLQKQAMLRLKEQGKERHLEVASLILRAPDGQQVDLVGAVHMADKPYFAQLNKKFTAYEAVLFELLIDENTPLHKQLKAMAKGERNNQLANAPEAKALGVLQFGQFMMAQLFDLSFQTTQIDYLAKNFVHADMTFQEFEKAQKEANETITSAVLKKAQGMEGGLVQREEDLNQILQALLEGENLPAKHFLAETLVEFTNLLAKEDETPESVLLQGRNEIVLKALQKQLDAGTKKLAVYYGAAHLPHLFKELTQQGYELEKVEWMPAWTMDKIALDE